jgi:hypothetical protein
MQGRLLYDWERGMIENAAWWHLQPAVLDMDDGARGLKRRPLAPNPHPRLIAYEAEKREFCSVTFLNEATRSGIMIVAHHRPNCLILMRFVKTKEQTDLDRLILMFRQ